jgi:hypothetical protein
VGCRSSVAGEFAERWRIRPVSPETLCSQSAAADHPGKSDHYPRYCY